LHLRPSNWPLFAKITNSDSERFLTLTEWPLTGLHGKLKQNSLPFDFLFPHLTTTYKALSFTVCVPGQPISITCVQGELSKVIELHSEVVWLVGEELDEWWRLPEALHGFFFFLWWLDDDEEDESVCWELLELELEGLVCWLLELEELEGLVCWLLELEELDFWVDWLELELDDDFWVDWLELELDDGDVCCWLELELDDDGDVCCWLELELDDDGDVCCWLEELLLDEDFW